MRPPNLSASAPKYRCGSSFEAIPMSGKFPRMGHGQGPGGRFLCRCMARWKCNTTSVDNNAAIASSMTRDLPTLSKSSKLELTTVSFTTCGRLEDPRAVCCSISTCRNPAHFLTPSGPLQRGRFISSALMNAPFRAADLYTSEGQWMVELPVDVSHLRGKLHHS